MESISVWKHISEAPVDGTMILLYGEYLADIYKQKSTSEIVGFYDCKKYMEHWRTKNGEKFLPSKWRRLFHCEENETL